MAWASRGDGVRLSADHVTRDFIEVVFTVAEVDRLIGPREHGWRPASAAPTYWRGWEP